MTWAQVEAVVVVSVVVGRIEREQNAWYQF